MTEKNQIGRDQKDISDAAFLAIHDLLKSRNAPKPGSYSSLTDEERRAYHVTARKKNRAKAREAKAAGDIKPTAVNIRSAFADAALMILATNSDGSDLVRNVLAKVFATRPGGRLRPLLFRRSAQ